jgi:hypothetical protein
MANPKNAGLNKGKSRRKAHHERTGKYSKQRRRTTINKAKAQKTHIANNPNDLAAIRNIKAIQDGIDRELLGPN